MRRPALLAVSLAVLNVCVLLVAGCGSEGTKTATPNTVEGVKPQPTQTTPTSPALKGDPVAGKVVFDTTAGCGGCHTLKASGSSGTIGPNLDNAQPDLALIVDRVTNGKGAMPAFGKNGSLTPKQVADVAAYVYQSTHG